MTIQDRAELPASGLRSPESGDGAKMDPALKAKWVEALDSGKYPQAVGLLRSANGRGFCCLGVLCDVMGAEWEREGAFLDGDRLDEEDEFLLTKETLRRVGLDQKTQARLAAMNDEETPFTVIARHIEANL